MKKGWEVNRLADCCEIVNGGTPKSAVTAYWGGEHSWVTPAEMGARTSPYLTTTRRTLTTAGLKNSSARLLPSQSVILSSRAPIGHLVINTVPMATNQGCKGLVPKSGLESLFLYYCLLGMVPQLDAMGTGATFKELSAGKLKEVCIPVPPLPDQRRIVAILDEAFEGIAAAKANVEESLRKQRDIFEGALYAQFNQSPANWNTQPLGEVVQIIGGSQPPKSTFLSAPRKDAVRLIQIRDYKSDKHKVYIPRAAARRFCSCDDVMIGRYGPPLFQILRGLEGAYNVALMKAVPDETQITKDYLFYFLRNPAMLSYVVFHSERAAGQIGVNKETLEPYPIRYPKITEQIRIVANLRRLEELSDNMRTVVLRKLAALDELKASLLHQAFTGQL